MSVHPIRYHNLRLLWEGGRANSFTRMFISGFEGLETPGESMEGGGGQVCPFVHIQNNLEKQGLTPLQHS